MTKRLGELLIKANLVTLEQVKKALDEQKVTGGSIGTNLIKLGYIDEDNLLAFLSKFYHVEPVKLSKINIDQKVLTLVPSGTAKKHLVMPVKRVGPKLILAMSDPSNIMVIDEIKFITGYNVQPVVAIDMDLVDAIKRFYGSGGAIAGMGNTHLMLGTTPWRTNQDRGTSKALLRTPSKPWTSVTLINSSVEPWIILKLSRGTNKR